jgi:SAM-dependent methyltransferase
MDKNYWHNRWEQGETKWDIGYISTPLKNFFDQLTNKEQKILIPGCGSGYEGEYLWRKGFTNVYQLDISEIPLQKFHQRVPEFPKEQLLATDFFALDGPFDLVIEQTFFCALHPDLRKNYASHMFSILADGGKICGLMFNFPLTENGPPFGGSKDEYETLFSPFFKIHRMEQAEDSIEPRAGNEFFVELQKI